MEEILKNNGLKRIELSKHWIIIDNLCKGNKKAYSAPYYMYCKKCGSGKIDLYADSCQCSFDNEIAYFFCKDCGEIMK